MRGTVRAFIASYQPTSQGYMPTDLWNLNSRYGSQDELRNLISSFHENGGCLWVSSVLQQLFFLPCKAARHCLSTLTEVFCAKLYDKQHACRENMDGLQTNFRP